MQGGCAARLKSGTVKLRSHNSNMRLSSILLRVGIGAIFQCVAFATSPGPPAAQTQAANSIGSNSATLNSYVDPSGLDTLVYFQYGLSTAYENSTPTGDVGTAAGHYGVPLSGLSASTTYHFRIIAANSAGTIVGNDLSFTTAPVQAPTAQTQAATSITLTAATFNAYINPNGSSTTAYFEYGTTTSYGSRTITGDYGVTAQTISLYQPSLAANATYHYRIVASNSGGTVLGDDISFTTGWQLPIAQTEAATSITSNSATFNASLSPNGSSTTAYFEYGTSTAYGSQTTSADYGVATQNVSISQAGLTPNTTYHFRIVASNNGGIVRGNDISFSTSQPTASVQTQPATLITTNSVTLNGYVNPNGFSTAAYFEYGISTSYGSQSPTVVLGLTAQSLSFSLSGLAPNAIYHYRVVAFSSTGTALGDDVSFTTSQQGPGAQTLAATLVTATSATFNGSINPNGSPTAAYFEYGTSASYGNQTASGNYGLSPQNILFNIPGLVPNTTYHYRIVASNNAGTVRGADVFFTTSQLGPTVQTVAATLVTTNSATLNGYINPSGSSTTAYFEYGTTTGYGSQTAPTIYGLAPQSVTFSLPGLASNTVYHYRLVASNSAGTVSGDDVFFTTSGQPPTAQTQGPTSVLANSVTLNGSVSPNGSTTTTYFEYGTTMAYGSQTTAVEVNASQAMSFNQTGLIPNTTYHYRIVAVNGAGTTSGNDVSFTTSASLPTAQTLAATSITTNSASFNGYIDPKGASTSAYFEYGTSTSYGSFTLPSNYGLTAQSISFNQTGLAANTTYHYRAVAFSSGGAVRGDDASFTTVSLPGQGPTAQTQPATSIVANAATFNGFVNPNGSSTTAYFEYGPSTSYGSQTAFTSVGLTAQNFSLNQTGLAPNTTYHYRLHALNTDGSNVGSDVSFTTPSAPPPLLSISSFSGLSVQALVPGTIRLEATTDFLHWSEVVTVTNASGSFTLTDPAATIYPFRFYRVQWK
jgi:hypothetical protein